MEMEKMKKEDNCSSSTLGSLGTFWTERDPKKRIVLDLKSKTLLSYTVIILMQLAVILYIPSFGTKKYCINLHVMMILWVLFVVVYKSGKCLTRESIAGLFPFTYTLLATHVCLQPFLYSKVMPEAILPFFSLSRIILPLALGVSFNIGPPLAVTAQTLMTILSCFCSPISFFGWYCYLCSEFLAVVYLFHNVHNLVLRQSEEKMQMAKKSVNEDIKHQKMSFIRRVAHDIGIHLTTLCLTIESLLLTELSEEQLEMVESLESTVDFMTVVRLDSFEMGQEGNAQTAIPTYTSVSLLRVIVNCERVMRNYTGAADVPIEFYMAPNIAPSLELDPNWLWSMLVNLLSNAKKFSFIGPIVVTFFAVPTTQGRKQKRSESFSKYSAEPSSKAWRKPNTSQMVEELRKTGQMLRVEVADLGVGIPPGKEKLLFKRFSLLHAEENKGGTGVGLHSVLTKAKALGGDAGWRPNSLAGKGSVFWIEVPYIPTLGVKGGAGITDNTAFHNTPSLDKLIIYGDNEKVFSKENMALMAGHFNSVTKVTSLECLMNSNESKLNMMLYIGCLPPGPAKKKINLQDPEAPFDPVHKVPSTRSLLGKASKSRRSARISIGPDGSQRNESDNYVMEWIEETLADCPVHKGESLAIMIIVHDAEGINLSAKNIENLRDTASAKNWHLIAGKSTSLQLDVIGIVTRQACRHDLKMPREFQSNSQTENSGTRSSRFESFSARVNQNNNVLAKQLLEINSTSRTAPKDGIRMGTVMQHKQPGSSARRIEQKPKGSITRSVPRDDSGVSERKGSEYADEIGHCSRHVLIVSDDKSLLKLFSRMLMRVGYGVSVACNPQEGFEMMKYMVYTAVLVTDMMVIFDEFQLIIRIRKWEHAIQGHPQRIILLGTGKVSAAGAKNAGVDVFVLRPYKFVQLVSAIEDSVHNGENSLSHFSSRSSMESSSMILAYKKNFQSGKQMQDDEEPKDNEKIEPLATSPPFLPSYNKFTPFCSSELPVLEKMFEGEEQDGARSEGLEPMGKPKLKPIQLRPMSARGRPPRNMGEKLPNSARDLSSEFQTVTEAGNTEGCPETPLPKQSILVVDNDPQLVDFLVRILNKEGHEVSVLDNGLKALSRLKKEQFDVAIIAHDVAMLNGIDCAKRYRDWEDIQLNQKRRTKKQHIIVSDPGSSGERERAEACGIDKLLSKPYAISDIIQSLRSFAENQDTVDQKSQKTI
mmetsp:Transcript_29860/g.38387  ORF Transcript_29860/g.38387 Transcript_29860/m.38387 type:complete len:1213 (+) Transcript_29860:346-3984(+)